MRRRTPDPRGLPYHVTLNGRTSTSNDQALRGAVTTNLKSD